ncbi:ATP-binding protein [Streptomyces sp. NPDC097704]|uniref:ATP-binding protein n=1 Tax=Streptomyces sp. NPDC097704 TaxID=3157101 RepID=UPI00331D5C3A
MADPAPRHCRCEGSGAAAQARDELRRFLDEALLRGHPVPEAVQDAALLVASELVTNAVRHARGSCTMDVGWEGDGIDIGVTDSSPDQPRPRAPDPAGSRGGWGWPVIQHLTSRVEVRPTDAGGKTVHVHMTAEA